MMVRMWLRGWERGLIRSFGFARSGMILCDAMSMVGINRIWEWMDLFLGVYVDVCTCLMNVAIDYKMIYFTSKHVF